MSLLKDVPIPAWVTESVEGDKLCFFLRLAALYHNDRGSLKQLSLAIGLSGSSLSVAVQRGQITPDHAVAIERLIGRSLFPRELFRPDLFVIPE